MTLGDLLHSTATKNPQKTAQYSGDDRMSYEELDESSTGLARWFVHQGMPPADRIAIHWPNSIPAVQLYFAGSKPASSPCR